MMRRYRAPPKTIVRPSDTAAAQVSGGRLQQGLDIAERESPASVTLRVTGNRGRVVGNDHLGVADLTESPHRRQYVHLAFVDDRLCIVVARLLRAHVAKVNVVDAVFAAEVPDDLDNILADLRGYAGIQSNAVRGTWEEVDQTLPLLQRREGLRDAAVARHRRIVRVQREAHVRFHRHRYHCFQKVAKPLPHLLVTRGAQIGDRSPVLYTRVVKAAIRRSAASGAAI